MYLTISCPCCGAAMDVRLWSGGENPFTDPAEVDILPENSCECASYVESLYVKRNHPAGGPSYSSAWEDYHEKLLEKARRAVRYRQDEEVGV